MSIVELFTAPDWGTVPDWLAAIGTLSAVGVALRLARRDGQRLEAEGRQARRDREEAARERALFREQQEAEAEERRRRLASRVSLEVEPFHDIYSRYIRWTVHNSSDQPITMVSVVRRCLPDENGENPTPHICKTWTSIEAGGRRVEETKLYDNHQMREGELQFTDGEGRRWQRLEFSGFRPMEPGDPQGIGMVVIPR